MFKRSNTEHHFSAYPERELLQKEAVEEPKQEGTVLGADPFSAVM